MTVISPLLSCHSHRLRIGFLLTLALFTSVTMRVNLNMAITASVNVTHFRGFWTNSQIERNATYLMDDGSDVIAAGYRGALEWEPPMQAVLFSATFWGSLVNVFWARSLIERLLPKTALSLSTFICILVTVITPITSEWSFPALFLARVVMGAAESLVVPAVGAISFEWFPPNERFAMVEMITSGNMLAASFSAIITAVLCMSPLGWQWAYYFYGIIATAWLLAWMTLAANTPEKCTVISESELQFLQKSNAHRPSPIVPTPWRRILTSKPFLACILCQMAHAYSGTIIQGFFPTFLRDELFLPLSMNGLLTFIPFGSALLTKSVLAVVVKYLSEKKILLSTARTKAFQSLSSLGISSSMIAIGFCSSSSNLWVTCLSLILFGISFSSGPHGFAVAAMSLFPPEHSGAVVQMSSLAAVIASIIAPMLMWLIMTLKVAGVVDSIWRTAFAVGCTLNLAAGAIFLIFGEANLQDFGSKSTKHKVRDILPSELNEDNSGGNSCKV